MVTTLRPTRTQAITLTLFSRYASLPDVANLLTSLNEALGDAMNSLVEGTDPFTTTPTDDSKQAIAQRPAEISKVLRDVKIVGTRDGSLNVIVDISVVVAFMVNHWDDVADTFEIGATLWFTGFWIARRWARWRQEGDCRIDLKSPDDFAGEIDVPQGPWHGEYTAAYETALNHSITQMGDVAKELAKNRSTAVVTTTLSDGEGNVVASARIEFQSDE